MFLNYIFSLFLYLINIFSSSCLLIYDKFTSAEISIPFKSISDRDNVVIKSNIFGETKNCSIDITSSEQLIYLSKKAFNSMNLDNNKYISLINQDGEKIEGYIKNTDIEFCGNEYRKSLFIENINSILIKSNSKNKIHSFGLSHNIVEENSIVHTLYNSHLISQRQFSILYSYPNWGTLSFGKEGTLVTDMKNLQRVCKAVNSTYWGCHLSGIYIEDVELPLEDEKIKKNFINVEINQDTVFDNGTPNVIVPNEIFQFFLDYYFEKSLFTDKKCKIYENYFYQKVICEKLNKNDFEEMKRIHFIFDDLVDIYLLGKYFFDKNKNFEIICVKNNDNIILGKVFLSHYYTIYNYDENTITFFGMFGGRYLDSKINYQKKIQTKIFNNLEYIRFTIPKINKNYFSLLKILFGFLLVGNVAIFIICKTRKKKKIKMLNVLLE